MFNRTPQVSICIPTFNRAELLKQSVDTVLGQSFEDFELIVSDNGSTDGTEEVIRSFDDKRIVYSRNAENVGILRNWNRCLARCRGEFITFLPDDDLMMPANLAAKVAVLARDRNLGLVHSKYNIIDKMGTTVEYNKNYGPNRTHDAFERLEDILLGMYCPMNAPTVVFRRSCYERLGEFVKHAGIGLAFDYEYWMRIALYYRVYFIAAPLIKWRIHAGTLTNINLGYSQTLLLIQTLAAKRYILNGQAHIIPPRLKNEVARHACAAVAEHAYSLLEEGEPNSRVREFVFRASRSFPQVLLDPREWKILVRTFLNRRIMDLLRRSSVRS